MDLLILNSALIPKNAYKFFDIIKCICVCVWEYKKIFFNKNYFD